MNELLKPLFQIWTVPPQQWHPLLIHFPIAFLFVESGLLGIFLVTRQAEYERWAFQFLSLSILAIALSALAGFHDVGLDLGHKHLIWLGLKDRWSNAFIFQSSVTVHVCLNTLLSVLTLLRFGPRFLIGSKATNGWRGLVYFAAAVLGIWILLAASYTGGLLTHH